MSCHRFLNSVTISQKLDVIRPSLDLPDPSVSGLNWLFVVPFWIILELRQMQSPELSNGTVDLTIQLYLTI